MKEVKERREKSGDMRLTERNVAVSPQQGCGWPLRSRLQLINLSLASQLRLQTRTRRDQLDQPRICPTHGFVHARDDIL